MDNGSPHNPPFSVVIVGGGVAGLTLAHSLAQHNIQFIILESRDIYSTAKGGFLGILPNGGRVLDNLGLLSEVCGLAEPVRVSHLWMDGRLVSQRNYPLVVWERVGYPYLFIRRGNLISTLTAKLGPPKRKILYGKHVQSITEDQNGAEVHCHDGSTYHGHVVVGADGVHSLVRTTLLEHAGNQTAKEQARSPLVEYICLFGTSTIHPRIKPGIVHSAYALGFSTFVVSSTGRTFWTLYVKQGLVQSLSHNSTTDTIRTQLKPFMGTVVGNGVHLDELFDTAVNYAIFPIEELFCQTWSHSRLVCIGDSAHKMAPNLGQGGNIAMESAYALACSLSSLVEHENLPSAQAISITLRDWEAAQKPRVRAIWQAAHRLMRLETFATRTDYLVAKYAIPWLGPYITQQQVAIVRHVGSQQMRNWRISFPALAVVILSVLLLVWGYVVSMKS
ncbi:hypothetical protein F4677DRAFT_437267 [Hypoxylon crocopeplum]|nr:hypothetical protein F4677DRAFT_437267 [Hypoxylon crocopeplum]